MKRLPFTFLFVFPLLFLGGCKDSPKKVLKDAADTQYAAAEALEQYDRGEISLEKARERYLKSFKKFHELADRWKALSEERDVPINELTPDTKEFNRLNLETTKASIRLNAIVQKLEKRSDVPQSFKEMIGKFYSGDGSLSP